MELNTQERLAINLTDTSKAYGYTLTVWGSGAMLIGTYGIPTVYEVMLFVMAGVIGFGLLALSVFGSLFGNAADGSEDLMLVAAMIHIVAAPVTVFSSYFITIYFPVHWGFFLVGANATIGYNVLLLVEDLLYEELYALERIIAKWIARLRSEGVKD